jgi:hypothetical protein
VLARACKDGASPQRQPRGVAQVVALAALSTPDGDSLPRLLLELVGALRGTDAVAVEVRCRRAEVLAHLSEDVDRVGDRVVLRF